MMAYLFVSLIILSFVVWLFFRVSVRFGALRSSIAFIVAIGIIYTGYKIAYPTYSWNQKLTITVDTPNGPVSGSSVAHVIVTEIDAYFTQSPGYKAQLSGEAAFLDLGGGRYLFALLRGQEDLAPALFASGLPLSSTQVEKAGEVLRHIGEAATLPRHLYPLLITFDDINDPASIKEVDPDNLAASFGSGTKLHSIVLRLTDEVVNEHGIEMILPCLNSRTCVPLNTNLPYGHPIQHVPNHYFWRDGR